MKNLFLFILLITTSFAASSQQYGWTDISANIPGSPDLSDVFFVSDDEGWITSSSQTEIYHTTDGGETFEIQSTQYTCNAIHMVSANEGYAGGAEGRVYRTTDGGENWIAIGSVGTTLSDLEFATAIQGYACSDGGGVFSITPGGVSNLNSGLATNLGGISAPSADNVWVCGGATISYYNGVSFSFQSGPTGSYNAIFFIDDQEGWIAGNSGLLGHTINGGNTWTSQLHPDPNTVSDNFFMDAEHGWAVGAEGSVIKTNDGGSNWVVDEDASTLTGTHFLTGVHFTSANKGYVVGQDKTLLKYSEVLGVSDDGFEELDFELYPNPCRDKLKIQNLKLETRDLKLEIIDITGKVMYEEKMGRRGDGEISVDVSHLPAGVYLVKLRTEDAVGVRKIIIQ